MQTASTGRSLAAKVSIRFLMLDFVSADPHSGPWRWVEDPHRNRQPIRLTSTLVLDFFAQHRRP